MKTAKTYTDSCARAKALFDSGMKVYSIGKTLEKEGFPTITGKTTWRHSTAKQAVAIGGAAQIKSAEPTPAELEALKAGTTKAAKRVVEPGTLRWEDVPEDIRADIKADIVAHLLRASGYGGGK